MGMISPERQLPADVASEVAAPDIASHSREVAQAGASKPGNRGVSIQRPR